jgi:hypothetical protein
MSFIEAIKASTAMKFSLLDAKGNVLAAEPRDIQPIDRIRLSTIFPHHALTGTQLAVGLLQTENAIHHCYLHLIYFVGNQAADCVRSHRLEARTRLLPLSGPDAAKPSPPRGQALKFMHFPTDGDYESWLVIWSYDEDLPAKLRFIDEAGNEYVENIVVSDKGVHCVALQDTLCKLNATMGKNLVVQLQSDYANFNANLYTSSRSRQSLSVDHLTGG